MMYFDMHIYHLVSNLSCGVAEVAPDVAVCC